MVVGKQSRRVSWPDDANLCKVRLFLSEEATSLAGLGSHDHLQAKGSWSLHVAGSGSSNDSLPPGFGASKPVNNFKMDVSQIPVIEWRCPPCVLLDPEWRVVAGEESEEFALQDRRILGVLEAIYPRQSNIPPNPSVSADVQQSYYDDSHTSTVPIIGVDDEDTLEQLEGPPPNAPVDYHQSDMHFLPGVRAQQILPTPPMHYLPPQQQPQHCNVPPVRTLPYQNPPAGVGLSSKPDVAAAASAAVTAMMRSNQAGNLIDQDLLIKLLNNPIQLEKLLSVSGVESQGQLLGSSLSASLPPPPTNVIASTSFSKPIATLLSVSPGSSIAPPVSLPPAFMNQLPLPIRSVSMNPLSNMHPSSKDVSYYKSLIQQHGGEKHEALGSYQNANFNTSGVEIVQDGLKVQSDVRAKIPKPCLYFNTPKGCRNGANCLFKHDSSPPMRNEQPNGPKRVKLDSRIAGRI